RPRARSRRRRLHGGAAAAEPRVPGAEPDTTRRRERENVNPRMRGARGRQPALVRERDVRRQIDLVQDDEVGRPERVRVFQRLVLALRHRGDDGLGDLAEVEQGRTGEIADVLDQHERTGRRIELVPRTRDHRRIEMTARAVVTWPARARGANAIGIELRGLIAFDHDQGHFRAQRADRLLEQRGREQVLAARQRGGRHRDGIAVAAESRLVVFKEGERPQGLMVLLDGTVEIFKDGTDEVLATIAAPTVLGEISLLTEGPHTASVRAQTACEFSLLTTTQFHRLLREESLAAYKVIATLAEVL